VAVPAAPSPSVYADPAKTPLKATVKPGDNVIDLKIE
jgi:hypothetical protein